MLVPRELVLGPAFCLLVSCTLPTQGVPPTCADGFLNQDESSVDCGGACTPCAIGELCRTSNDCTPGVCDTAESGECEPADVCGNGLIEAGEACDDGNLADEDGCNEACLKEIGAPCSRNTECATGACDTSFRNECVPGGTCGNGLLEAGEGCDDAGTVSGDGCSENCLLELGEACAEPNQCASGVCDDRETPAVCEPVNVCGNGRVESGEICDDGNEDSGDGCNSDCKKEIGQLCEVGGECESKVCDRTEEPSVCEPADVCGNGTVEDDEACDDGNNTASDGCSAGCLRENGQTCAQHSQCLSGACSSVSGTCVPSGECGNGIVDTGEACDDGNTDGGDGCSPLCKKELGQPCAGSDDCASGICDQLESNTCEPVDICGNGVRETGEACDDGGRTPGDGCSSSCRLENNEPCARDEQCQSGICDATESPPRCERADRCGNSRLEGLEACDDGNRDAGDGCAPNCRLEDGQRCANNAECLSTVCDFTEMPDVCEPANTCGNSKLEDFEACDDGGLETDDGCDASCLKENGQICAGDDECASSVCDGTENPDVCEAAGACGNGRVDDGEACDDGNTSASDGCDADCLKEDGQDCTDGEECASGACDTMFSGQCVPSGVCGNGILDDGEACDDAGVTPGDGCDENCKKELGAACSSNSECGSGVCDLKQSNACEPADTCGNGVEEGTEGCDDGNDVSGDGCSATCLLEMDGVCLTDDQCETGVCDTTETPNMCEPANTCGNGRIEDLEVCDDGNVAPGDACGPTCLLSNGATCTAGPECESGVCDTTEDPDTCEPANICGNGVLDVSPFEGCDDGNTVSGDGCNAACLLEANQPCAFNVQCASGACPIRIGPRFCL